MTVSPNAWVGLPAFLFGIRIIWRIRKWAANRLACYPGEYLVLFFFFTACSSLQNFFKKNRLKCSSLLDFDAVCFSFYLWHRRTLSSHCLTQHRFDWRDALRQELGLIWSKLRTSGWVVVLRPCLCWMSTPCLSREQPTGIPQIWHTALHAHREKGEEGRKKK